MNEVPSTVELDRVLPHLLPQDGFLGEEIAVLRPKKSAPCEEGAVFSDTPLTLRLRSESGEFSLRGTAHRIHKNEDGYTVEEEIALNRQADFHTWRKDYALLRAQILTLALLTAKGISHGRIRLSVYAEGEVTYQDSEWTKEELSRLLRPYFSRLESLLFLYRAPGSSIEFPHKHLRAGQKTLIHAVWDAIKGGKRLFACAPTGIGKTVAVLYPALKALETKKIERVYYASPKNTLKQQAAEAVQALQREKNLRTLVLEAKMRLCPEGMEECRKAYCEYAEAFWEKLPDALAYLASYPCVTAEVLSAAAQRFTICPFELALQYQSYCQVVIGDYNHLIDPSRALFKPEENSLLLVDEAHNLPARTRDGYTETLSREDLDFFFRDPSHASQMLRARMGDLSAEFARLDSLAQTRKKFHEFEKNERMEKLVDELIPVLAFALREGFGTLEDNVSEAVRALYRKCKHFQLLCRRFDASFATIYPPEGGIRIYPVEARELIAESAARWKSIVYFSATLAPKDYYFRLLGGEEGDPFLSLPSPFLRENLFVGLVDVDVSYRQRFVTAPQICSIIRTATAVKEGNYMVFLPGFDYLRLVVQEFKKQNFNAEILVQSPTMSRREREAFLAAFRKERQGTLIGFCVLGGIFSEGIDLKGEALSGEILVGTGFPPPTPEGEAEAEAYYKKEMDGKSFAYTLPGWNRVLQAAGRVIRSENDRGFLILCDSRYCQEDGRALFPESWEDAEILTRQTDLRKALERFW